MVMPRAILTIVAWASSPRHYIRLRGKMPTPQLVVVIFAALLIMMYMSTAINWGILSTGAIAKTFARGLAASKTGTLVAVGSRSQEKADEFGEAFDIPRGGRFARYEALLADPNVNAVYIAPPHPLHAHWAIKAAEAKKHLLVEKPIGVNHAEAMAIVEAAIANDVFLMEAFMYRCHPQTARLVELLREKIIGDVRLIQASFGFHA